jgi:hypothetical protein
MGFHGALTYFFVIKKELELKFRLHILMRKFYNQLKLTMKICTQKKRKSEIYYKMNPFQNPGGPMSNMRGLSQVLPNDYNWYAALYDMNFSSPVLGRNAFCKLVPGISVSC